MNSRDKKQREQALGAYKLTYGADENQLILKKAEMVGMTPEEYVKFVSLHSVEDYSIIKSDLTSKMEENKKLKAKLAFFTDDINGGLFLDIEPDILLAIRERMHDYKKHFDTVEDYVIYSSINLNRLITDAMRQTFEQFKALVTTELVEPLRNHVTRKAR